MYFDFIGQYHKMSELPPPNLYPLKSDVPKVYHRKCNAAVLDDIYTAKEDIDYTKAYFISNPGNYKVNMYDQLSGIEYIESNNSGSRLVPNGIKTGIRKLVSISNKGEKDAYVRLHLAIPSLLNNNETASKNALHYNVKAKYLEKGAWNWSDSMDRDPVTFVKNDNWNRYFININGIDYDVYIIAYESILKSKASTVPVIYQVYLDTSYTEEMIIELNKKLGTNKWEILSLVEAVSVDKYDNPMDAFLAKNMITGQYNPFK